MKKVICVPDSFKGTMSSATVCNVMKQEIQQLVPSCEVILIEVADGGEGSVDAFLAAIGGNKIWCDVQSPFGLSMPAFYGMLDKHTAVVEMAACAGLPLVGEQKDPEVTTTFGVGQLILDAAMRGCQKIIVGLGGSATNDGGCGAASAIGVKFFDAYEQEFVPTGATLKDIVRIDRSQVHPALTDIEIITMCDIDNPLYGERGAAYIYGPQKGADITMVKRLDAGLFHLAGVIESQLQLDVSMLSGGGAAGGMGAGMVAFFGARLQMGIETILDTVGFDDLLVGTDYVFTGEGKIDSQSLRGKVPIGVARRAKKQQVPVIAVVGAMDDDIDSVYDEGISAIFSINPRPESFDVAKHVSTDNLGLTMHNIVRLLCTK